MKDNSPLTSSISWTTNKPTMPGFYWMKAEGLRSRVIEIKKDQHHGLYIVQNNRALVDIAEYDREWAGPLEPPHG